MIKSVRQKRLRVWLCFYIQERWNGWHVLIVAAKLGSQSLQGALDCNDISSGCGCTQCCHPQALSFIFVCVCVCAIAVALPPEKTDSCCVEEKMQERDSQSPAGPQKQLQFEVSVKTGHLLLPPLDETRAIAGHTNTHSHTVWYWFNAGLFQELECAVSVEEDNRQEWTFTLYDFDNSGKVTREVIACFSGKAFNCLMNK